MTILTDKNIKWREYQKRLLAQLPKYMTNQSIHLVAPPGSGKTYLGIEIIRQLDKKSLILVPSLVLKKQWIDTIQASFLNKEIDKVEVSDSIDSLKEITIETYQTIYSRLAEDEAFLERENIAVLVLDEAHHLKKSWGEVLLKLKKAAPNLMTVSLTATPPYDTNLQQWHQYQLLNGPIDEEISIPELIKEQVLAHHQDYLYLVSAPAGIVDRYEKFRQKQAAVVETIVASTEIADYLLKQPFIEQPKAHEEFIYQSFEVYLSSLLFLQLHGYQLRTEHWELLGITKAQGKKRPFPAFEKHHMVDLLVYIYKNAPDMSLFAYLEQHGWIAQEQLQLFPSFSERIVNQAPIEKKEAICRILLCEHEKMGKEFSGLVLTDFIKKEVLLGKNGELEYGLVPIVDSLIPFFKDELGVAAVCGEFLIIPKIQRHYFLEISTSINEHPDFNEYCIIYLSEQKRTDALIILTHLVNKKIIQLLVGTSSLLGEGWDCPAINTVVLANQSVSFVQTQQLRGRGLRIDEKEKTTNIWHLAVVLPELDYSKQVDVKRIMKRMSYICGLTFEKQPNIESGMERFNLLSILSGKEIAVHNQEMLYWSGERKQLAQFWKHALEKGNHLAMPLIVRKDQPINTSKSKHVLVNHNLTRNLIKKTNYNWIGISILSAVGIMVTAVSPILGGFILGVDGIAVLFTVNKKKISDELTKYTRKKIWQKEMNTIRHLAFSVVETFIKQDMMEADGLERIVIEESEKGCACYLDQATYQEDHLFYTTMKEALSSIQNPRYFIDTKKSNILTVPEIFARNKKTAELFQEAVDRYFSVQSELIYSRNLEGRKKLVQAKISKAELDRDSIKHEIIQKNVWV